MTRLLLSVAIFLSACMPDAPESGRSQTVALDAQPPSVDSDLHSLAMAELKIAPSFEFKTQTLVLVDLSMLERPELADQLQVYALFHQQGEEHRWQLADLALADNLSGVQLSVPLVANQLEFQWQRKANGQPLGQQLIALTRAR